MVYHTSPTSDVSLPSLFNMSAADHDTQMDLDFARANLYYEFGSSLSWAATGEANPMF